MIIRWLILGRYILDAAVALLSFTWSFYMIVLRCVLCSYAVATRFGALRTFNVDLLRCYCGYVAFVAFVYVVGSLVAGGSFSVCLFVEHQRWWLPLRCASRSCSFASFFVLGVCCSAFRFCARCAFAFSSRCARCSLLRTLLNA